MRPTAEILKKLKKTGMKKKLEDSLI